MISDSWQDWLAVLGYIVFAGFITWRVLKTNTSAHK